MRKTKKHAQRLELIESYLSRALKYIHSDDIEICRKGIMPNGLSFTNKQGKTLDTINKKAGSPIQFIEHAHARIEQMLKEIQN